MAASSNPSPSNQATYLTKAGRPLILQPSTYPTPGPDQILVKVHAVAINPVDWILQYVPFIFPHLKLPCILGSDVAGEVVSMGAKVSRFTTGDRVLGLAVGGDKRSNNHAECGFQEYVVLRDTLTSPIPSTMSFEEACVLPLGLSTAACSLYQKDLLGLDHPSLSPATMKGETVIVWGASTSVGCNAVQLARASGYNVITTCSPKNYDYVKSLGAQNCFDYRSTTVVKDIVAALQGQQCAGALAICEGSTEACVQILSATKGKKLVVRASAPLGSADLTKLSGRIGGLLATVQQGVSLKFVSAYKGVSVKMVFGSDLMENEVGGMIFRDFLPAALADRRFVAAPSPQIVGNGLDKIQTALDINRKGMSAGKAVVTLQ